ncbi:hypothetical protein SAMN04488131_1173 [Flavobacterium xueshanense]|uniref:Uncharacterized protein n=1 Tax=Flavobacterium xueshanense TaxID=935223 RepID=A0A1I2I197_9FLAO|nr:hypothetical protein SAMN04488131_1173 [Flavobacterium xueshanense]
MRLKKLELYQISDIKINNHFMKKKCLILKREQLTPFIFYQTK